MQHRVQNRLPRPLEASALVDPGKVPRMVVIATGKPPVVIWLRFRRGTGGGPNVEGKRDE